MLCVALFFKRFCKQLLAACMVSVFAQIKLKKDPFTIIGIQFFRVLRNELVLRSYKKLEKL